MSADRRLLAVASAVLVSSLAVCASALGAGGVKPSAAPTIEVGHHYFGNTNHPDNLGGTSIDLWHLPPLLANDEITVAWNATGEEQPSMCLAQDVDDYSWGEQLCNGSRGFDVSGSGSARTPITAQTATGAGFLEFESIGYYCCPEPGPSQAYDFVVESIQHTLAVDLKPVYRIRPKAILVATAVLSDGTSVPDGTAFVLRAAWPGGGLAHFKAASAGGVLSFEVSLPNSTRGQTVAFTVRKQPDPQYLLAKSATQRIKVAKRRHHRRRRHH